MNENNVITQILLLMAFGLFTFGGEDSMMNIISYTILTCVAGHLILKTFKESCCLIKSDGWMEKIMKVLNNSGTPTLVFIQLFMLSTLFIQHNDVIKKTTMPHNFRTLNRYLFIVLFGQLLLVIWYLKNKSKNMLLQSLFPIAALAATVSLAMIYNMTLMVNYYATNG
tara:strand:+ start:489 stop:992 length:504 start_codon:yes stop_codon:yes gene_type:complete